MLYFVRRVFSGRRDRRHVSSTPPSHFYFFLYTAVHHTPTMRFLFLFFLTSGMCVPEHRHTCCAVGLHPAPNVLVWLRVKVFVVRSFLRPFLLFGSGPSHPLLFCRRVRHLRSGRVNPVDDDGGVAHVREEPYPIGQRESSRVGYGRLVEGGGESAERRCYAASECNSARCS